MNLLVVRHAIEDGEALHDFPVAIRRLRTTIRAYRRELRGGAGSTVRLRRLKVPYGVHQ